MIFCVCFFKRYADILCFCTALHDQLYNFSFTPATHLSKQGHTHQQGVQRGQLVQSCHFLLLEGMHSSAQAHDACVVQKKGCIVDEVCVCGEGVFLTYC